MLTFSNWSTLAYLLSRVPCALCSSPSQCVPRHLSLRWLLLLHLCILKMNSSWRPPPLPLSSFSGPHLRPLDWDQKPCLRFSLPGCRLMSSCVNPSERMENNSYTTLRHESLRRHDSASVQTAAGSRAEKSASEHTVQEAIPIAILPVPVGRIQATLSLSLYARSWITPYQAATSLTQDVGRVNAGLRICQPAASCCHGTTAFFFLRTLRKLGSW